MRAAAWISADPAMTEVYSEGRDLHRENAAAIAGVSVDEVNKDQRSAAKPVGFGSIYGMGAAGLSAAAWNGYGIEMSVADAELALARFFTKYHRMKAWMRRQADQCRHRGVIEIGTGRVVEAAWEPEGQLRYTLCVNAPIQGICADCAMRAMIGIYRDLAAFGIAGGLVAVVHDELILEVLEDDAERARVVLETAMTRAFIETFPGAPTKGVASASIGRSWAEMK
jgi:DNA polymerase-1